MGTPNGLELSRSAEAGGAPPTLAPAGDQNKPIADSAEQPSRQLDSPHLRAMGGDLSTRPPSRLQRVVGRQCDAPPWMRPGAADGGGDLDAAGTRQLGASSKSCGTALRGAAPANG